jgi:tRNA G18 (ribose-2'-O)-methylase SpoU
MGTSATRRVVEPDDPCLDPYRQLVSRERRGDIVVEGRIAVQRALTCGWHPRSVVGTASMLAALRDAIPADAEVFELDAAALRDLVGFDFHRGCLAAFDRPAAAAHPAEELLTRLRDRGRSTIVVAHGLADPANLGAVARTARALGADLLVVDARAADPYERRAIRASMGHVLCLPLVSSPDLLETLAFVQQTLRVRIVAATTGPEARALRPGRPADHVVIVVGNEGVGLPPELTAAADEEVTIEMAPAVDSLNVAAALGIVLWAMR